MKMTISQLHLLKHLLRKELHKNKNTEKEDKKKRQRKTIQKLRSKYAPQMIGLWEGQKRWTNSKDWRWKRKQVVINMRGRDAQKERKK